MRPYVQCLPDSCTSFKIDFDLRCSYSIPVPREAIKLPFSEPISMNDREKTHQQEKISILADQQPRLDLLPLIVEDLRLDDIL